MRLDLWTRLSEPLWFPSAWIYPVQVYFVRFGRCAHQENIVPNVGRFVFFSFTVVPAAWRFCFWLSRRGGIDLEDAGLTDWCKRRRTRPLLCNGSPSCRLKSSRNKKPTAITYHRLQCARLQRKAPWKATDRPNNRPAPEYRNWSKQKVTSAIAYRTPPDLRRPGRFQLQFRVDWRLQQSRWLKQEISHILNGHLQQDYQVLTYINDCTVKMVGIKGIKEVFNKVSVMSIGNFIDRT